MKTDVGADFMQNNKEISDLLLRIPRELLLLLKTNDCLRSVDLCLGETVNTFVITGRECTLAMARFDYDHSVLGNIRSAAVIGLMECRILAMHITSWLYGLRSQLSAWRSGFTPV